MTESSIGSSVWRHIRGRIVSGVLLLVPVAVTFVVLRFLYRLIHANVRPLLKVFAAFPIPEYVVAALAVVALFAGLYGAGVLARMVVGRRIIGWGESILARIPLVKSVYGASKNLVDMLSTGNRSAFKSVVFIEFPRPGLRTMGFQTGEVTDRAGRTWYKVFIPTTPNPTSGYLEIVPADEVFSSDLAVEDGIKLIVSGGILSPSVMDVSPPPAPPAAPDRPASTAAETKPGGNG